MMTGKILQLIKLLLGVSNMILEMLKIDGLKDVCSKKTKSKDKNKRKITSKLSKILLVLLKSATSDFNSI